MKRRNSIAILCSAVFCFGLVLSGCNNNTSVPGGSSLDNVTNTWTVAFDSQGGSEVAAQIINDGDVAVRPADPTREDYEFLGWYEETAAITPFDFNTPITTNWTLYAGWRRGQVEPPVEEYPYYVRIGEVTKGLTYYYGPEGNLLAEYTVNFDSVQKDDIIEFLDASKTAIYENIGPEPGNNNGVASPTGFVIHNDATDVSVYFKNWQDGGHSFWITGYEDETTPVDPEEQFFKIIVGDTAYALDKLSLEGCPANQVGNFSIVIPEVHKDQIVYFVDYYDNEVLSNIGSEPEDNENHNNIVGVAGDFYIHNDASNVTVYFKTWDDGGHSFWMTGYEDETDSSIYVTIINGVEYEMTKNTAASLSSNQVAEYMTDEISLVQLDQEISFMKDGSYITRIGTDPSSNNNAVGNSEDGFHVRSDAIDVTMYLKEYDDGGYAFFLTGYTDDYKMNIAGIDYAMTENLDFQPIGNYVREFYVELESVEAGLYFSFTNNGADITENMVVDSGMNNALWDGMGYTFHNDAADVTVYLKLTEDYQHSLWITGFDLVDNYIYTVNNCPDWIRNDGCLIFAWVMSAGYVDTWVPVYFVDSTTVKFGTNYELDSFLLVRCVSTTTQPSWEARGNEAGRIYNQTYDISCTSGVYTYASGEWRGYP